MNNFIALDPPSRAISSPKFYITSVVEAAPCGYMYLRNDGKGTDDGSGDFDLYLFDTKLEAHEEALIYYHGHGVTYIHIDDLLALGATGKVNNSQVMEFI